MPQTELDLEDVRSRATRAAQTWAPGCEVTELVSMEGGTVGLVYAGAIAGGPAEHPTVVLKIAPPGLPPLRNRDVLRQARCIQALDGQPGVGVPPFLFSDEGEPDDIPPFFATGRVEGECEEPLLEAERNRRSDEVIQGRAHAAHPAARAGLSSGMPSDVELLAPYESETGTSVPDLEWFHALTRYKEAAAMALIAKLAVRRGQGEMIREWGDMVPGLVADACQRVS